MQQISRRSFEIVHVSRTYELPATDFIAAFDGVLGTLDRNALTLMRDDPAAAARQIEVMQGPHGLMLFDKLDHGVLFAMSGRPRVAYRYHVGNPLIAWRMTRIDVRAALYAPLTVLIDGADDARTRIEYDLPSTVLGQFGNGDVRSVGLELDDKLNAAIEAAAQCAAARTQQR
ncbi:DUF302 domain-containing protein [Burkholderia dolosa]|uniref:DUF302 domain-containing protein n=1 Tax=Burkholderia dolosa TaxID=152500 RepID=A0A892I771_9BURK|nr:DUF302 domain-containing protein [Burkholderia dolosa]PUA73649.1 DUF302 domain-containing protein [Burkholderia sp. AU29985]AYZ98784.1 DUF302 domain-containing protein [Burkholderia dolosa]EAY69157.1 hypothetical protein BDAG_01907 [Burkholderia dolosa AU0158]MCC5026972.1 DUF302 domain-containing protein [Burkholderia dolosa]QRO76760.1 DUF302 domain-containing protein [Burkholderia dolosa]